jgi:GDP-mannose transporter
MAIVYLPNPSLVSFIQILFAACAVLCIRATGYPVDWFEMKKLKAYAMYVLIFVLAIYTNMQALSVSNVETVIVFRACTPISVCVLEYFFMNRELPSLRSSISLSVVACGAIFYCLCDSQLAMHGIKAYFWVVTYFCLITVEMTYGKQLTSSVKMESVWGPVLYCNALSVLPMFLLGASTGDLDNAPTILSNLPFNGVCILLFSCVAGTLIGYTGWLCRGMTSATTFTLVGVVNKFLTVLLNVIIWDKHSSSLGVTAVCICLMAGFFYQQAPRRDEGRKTDVKAARTLVTSDGSASPVKFNKSLLVAEEGGDNTPLLQDDDSNDKK